MFQSLLSGILNRVLPRRSHHTPSPEDVFMVREYLENFVPPELTYLISDHAKYWPKASFRWKTHLEQGITIISASSGPDNSATSTCLVTPKLRDWIGQGAGVKPRAVHFKILSHDQGWSSEPNPPGLYGGSWTWFEAAIIRDFDETTIGGVEAGIGHALDSRGRSEDTKIITTVKPPYGDSDVWYLQRNVRASSVEKAHEIIWTDELEIGDEENPGHVSDETGRGQGVGFVKSLQLDDRIAVIARAQYPGWANHILDLAVEIEYAI